MASAYYMQRLFGLQLDISGLWWNKWFLSGVSLLEGSLSLILLVRLLYFLYCANGPNHGVYGVMAGYIYPTSPNSFGDCIISHCCTQAMYSGPKATNVFLEKLNIGYPQEYALEAASKMSWHSVNDTRSAL